MSSDLISISVAAYNHQDYIQELIFSCINQTYKNIELIIIDDGSTDKTYEKMCELKDICEKRFARVVFKTQKNVGALETCNRLRQLIQGKYIYCIGSDDVIGSRKAIEFLHSFLAENEDYGLAVGDQDYIDGNSEPIPESELPSGTDKAVRRDSSYMKWLLEYAYGDLIKDRSDVSQVEYVKYSDFWFSSPVSNGYLVRKKYLDMMLPVNINVCNIEDLYMHYQLTKVCKYKIFKRVLFHYRLHKSNYSNSNWDRNAIQTRGLRFYEMWLLENTYKDFFDEDCLKAPNFISIKKEWEICKKSKYWDEEYYVNKYPEVKEQGWIPLVHYLSWGIEEGRKPCKIFENVKLKKHVNPLLILNKRKYRKYLFVYNMLESLDKSSNIFKMFQFIHKKCYKRMAKKNIFE